eukprot:jgi/Chrpa1/28050/Chrysochromulina_OHIO_Genome00010654-RA
MPKMRKKTLMSPAMTPTPKGTRPTVRHEAVSDMEVLDTMAGAAARVTAPALRKEVRKIVGFTR